MLRIHPAYRATFRDLGLTRAAEVQRHYVSQPVFSEEPAVIIRVGLLGPVQTFYKVYRFARPSWRFWGRPTKARREFHNLRRIIQLGVACAEPIACGERRDLLGRLRCAFVITPAVPDAPPMDRFVPERCPDSAEPGQARLRRAMLDELADQVAAIHRGRFAHNDLHWRNVFVQLDSDDRPRLVWIDCPRGGRFVFAGLGDRKMIKDLATLDRTAVTCCTLRERLRFACRNHRRAGVSVPLREWVARVEGYRLKRWREVEAPLTPRGQGAGVR